MKTPAALLVATLFLSTCGPEREPATDLKLFHGGTVYTGTAALPTAEAVLVEGERIVFVGALAEARRRAGKAFEDIDLKGAFLYPGFADAHAHLLGVGQRELVLNLEGAASIADVQRRLAEYAAALPPGADVVGRGWIETHWPEGRPLNRHDLDAAVSDRAVYLARADGHAATANSAALARLGITGATPEPAGGFIAKDEAGEPTGYLVDAAKEGPERLFFEALNARRPEAYARGAAAFAAKGWTQIHNMGDTVDEAEIMERLADSGEIRIRIYNAVQAYFPALGVDGHGEALLEEGPRQSANGKVVTRAIKLYMDGGLGSRGAYLFEPYRDADTSGLLLAEREVYFDFMTRALRSGIQVSTHAIGDKANRKILDWYEEIFRSVPPAERAVAEPRWRIEHAQHVSRADWPRFAKLGVIASMQPSDAIGDLYFAPARLGQDRLAEAYAWRPLLEAGAVIAGGSDAPVEQGDPRIEFYAAVARRALNGFSGEGWHPESAVSREAALRMFTLNPAIASFREHELGTIEEGKLADFSVFGADLMAIPAPEIPAAPVVMTVVGGEIIYRNPDF